MKKRLNKLSERRNSCRSRRQERQNPFLERILEERLTDLYKALLMSQQKTAYAVLDKIAEIEALQMDLVRLQSLLTQKLFPDYVPAVREEASEDKGYHELYMN